MRSITSLKKDECYSEGCLYYKENYDKNNGGLLFLMFY